MDEVFGETEAVAYFDGLLIPGKDLQEHDSVMGKVIEAARSGNVRFNKSKIQYRQTEVKFLGFLWSCNQIKIDADRVLAIKALSNQEPKTRKQLQRVCAVFYHLRK